jgi:hypothetical protein
VKIIEVKDMKIGNMYIVDHLYVASEDSGVSPRRTSPSIDSEMIMFLGFEIFRTKPAPNHCICVHTIRTPNGMIEIDEADTIFELDF